MFDIITFGSAVIDLFAKTEKEADKAIIGFPVGSKSLIEELRFSTGGGGTNTGVAFSKLGFKVGFIGKLGNDEGGDIILKELKKNKVDFLGKRGNGKTGYSIVLGGKKGTRTILTYRGENNEVKFSDIPLKKIKANWFYFSSSLEKSLKTQLKLSKYAKRRGIKVAYNASAYQIRHEKRLLKRVLKRVDVLILNKEEAELLVGKRKNLFEKLRKLGPKVVCITNGEKGAKAFDGIHIHKTKPTKKVKSRENTGAGDAFAAGFLSAIIKNKELYEAMEIGRANAVSVIKKPGAKNGLLSWNSLIKDKKRSRK